MSGPENQTLRGVVAAAARGDVGAFERIVGTYHAEMKRVCVVVSRDVALADEALRAAWPLAWKRMGKVKDPARLRPWLMSIALEQTMRLMREPRRPPEPDGSGARDGFGGYPPGTAIGKLDVRDRLEAMDPGERALLAMRYLAGFDEAEVATASGVKESVAHDRLEATMLRLRTELADG